MFLAARADAMRLAGLPHTFGRMSLRVNGLAAV
jgi:hypothetical protein